MCGFHPCPGMLAGKRHIIMMGVYQIADICNECSRVCFVAFLGVKILNMGYVFVRLNCFLFGSNKLVNIGVRYKLAK